MMGGLKMPDSLSGGGIETDDAGAEEIVARAVATVVVVGGGAEREVDVA